MKLAQVALLAFSALCAAQLQNLPNCAKPCASSLPENCNLDVKCICSHRDFITDISCCVANACPIADQEKTLKVAQQFCDTVKVSLPAAAGCGPSSAAAGPSSAVAAGMGTASSAMSAATMMASSAVAGGQSMASSAGSATTATESAAPGTTNAPFAGSVPDAAQKVVGSIVGVVGAVAAALALI